MAIFIFLAIYLILINVIIPERKRMRRSIWSALGFVMVLALRSPYCGLDVTGTTSVILPNSYGGRFLNMPNYSFWDIFHDPSSIGGHMEIGWLVLNKVISLFTNDLQVFLVIIAILQFIPIAYVLGKYSCNVTLSFFVFACLGFYIHYFSGIRQMLAVSIIVLAFDQLYQKRYIWFVVIVLIASTIHSSSVLFLLVWPLSLIRLSFILSIICVAGMLVLMPLYRTIVSDVLAIFFNSRYEGYLNSEGVATTMFVVYTLFFLSSFLINDKSAKINLIRIILLVGVFCQSLGILGNSAITRVGFSFNVFLSLLLPEIASSFNKKTRGLITALAVVLLCIFFALTTSSVNSSGAIPYKFFWEAPAFY